MAFLLMIRFIGGVHIGGDPPSGGCREIRAYNINSLPCSADKINGSSEAHFTEAVSQGVKSIFSKIAERANPRPFCRFQTIQ